MNRLISTCTLVALAAGLAHGQVNITAQTRNVQAVGGNGSGTDFLQASDLNSWNHSVGKTWGVGFNNINQQSAMTPWRFDCDMYGENSANTVADAGSISSRYRVDFTVSTPIDVYTLGTFTGDNTSAATMRLWNRTTNATIVSGNGYQHLAPGNYAFEQYLNMSTRGIFDGTTGVQFRPGNDNCAYATAVTNGSYIGSTVLATNVNDGAAACNTPGSPTALWFKYTAPRAGALTLSTCGSSFDTVLTVFNNGNCNIAAGNILACNDDAPAGASCGYNTNASNVTVNVNTGEQFLIRLSGYNNTTGDFRLNVGPVNDRCDSMIAANLGDNPFDNRLADTDGSVVNSCVFSGDNQINGDLWYYYQPTADGTLTVGTCGSTFDTKLVVYNGYSCGASGYMACSDDNCGLQSRIENIPVVQGHWYTIRVGGYSTNRGVGNLNLAFAPACSADFNRDGVVDFFDYLDFVDTFASNGAAADFNTDSVVDFFDYLDFVNAFASGC